MTAAPPQVSLPELASPAREVWHVLLDLAGVEDLAWTLVGGQMVLFGRL